MEITQELQTLGLNQKEASVFLACLELGPSTISDIARRADIKRTTVYNLIDPLLQKNILSKIPHKKSVLYRAEPPRHILTQLEERRRKFEHLLPQLESLYQSQGTKPRVQFHEGKEGIIKTYNEIFSTVHKIYAIGSMKDICSVVDRSTIVNLFGLLRKNGGKIYELLDNSEETKEYISADYHKGLGTNKILPDDFEIAIDMMIYKDTVAFFSLKSLIVVVIKDAAIAKSQLQYFKFIWKHIK